MINNTQETTKGLRNLLSQKEALIAQKDEQIAYLQAEINWFREQILLAKSRQFGPSSEKTAGIASLFDEAEITADPKEPEPTVEQVAKPRKKKDKGHREVQLKDLTQRDEHHEIPQDQRICPQCAGNMNDIGVETTRQVVAVPAHFEVVNHHQHKYACPHCQKHDVSTPVIEADVPKPPIPGSIASPSLLAFIAERKYVQAMPLYRQEVSLQRDGIEISRQTMANWMIFSAGILTPVYDLFHETLLEQEIVRADETTLQVLREPGRKPQTDSYLWHYGCHVGGVCISLFEYQPTRHSDHPKKFLNGFGGFLQVDGYSAYECIPTVTLIGCLAHARRKFEDAIKTLPENVRKKGNTAAHTGFNFFNTLYRIEREIAGKPDDIILETRQDKSQKVLDQLKAWLDIQAPQIVPKSAFGIAVTYSLNQWTKLVRYLLDPRLEIDNNRAERSIRPFAVGRRNWLFANSTKGAQASAILYSIVETAKENGLHPRKYIEYLLENLPNRQKGESLTDLLPWEQAARARCGPGISDT